MTAPGPNRSPIGRWRSPGGSSSQRSGPLKQNITDRQHARAAVSAGPMAPELVALRGVAFRLIFALARLLPAQLGPGPCLLIGQHGRRDVIRIVLIVSKIERVALRLALLAVAIDQRVFFFELPPEQRELRR
jgi:hypothetical protein